MGTNEMVKINLGSGGERGREDLKDFISIDIANGDIKIDVTKGLPFEGETVSYIRAHHILEHIDRFQTLDVLKDCYRVLKHGGQLDIAVPDLDYAVSIYKTNRSTFNMMIFAGDGKPEETSNPYQYHHSAFDEEELTLQLKGAGFEVGVFDYPEYYGKELHTVATKL